METVLINRADPEFAEIVTAIDAGCEVANAPRPIYADRMIENGPWRRGRFYAIWDPKGPNSDLAEYVRANWQDMGAAEVVLTSNAEIEAAIKTRVEADGYTLEEIIESWGSMAEVAHADGRPWYEEKK